MTRPQTTVERAAALLGQQGPDDTGPVAEPAHQDRGAPPASSSSNGGHDAAAAPPGDAGVRPGDALPPETVGAGRGESPAIQLDMERLEAKGFVSPFAPTTRVAEEFRLIKRQLLRRVLAGHGSGDHGKVIVVTSSAPREGKTFVAINLALSLAIERDLHVMLIDADVVRPSVFKTLGLRGGKGLVDVLDDETLELSDLIVRTDVAKLSLLPAGTRNPMATELLSSERMTQLIDELATRYPDRIVIMDSPPLLAASEASVLAHKCGQIVFVVEAERTSEGMLRSSLEMIHDCPDISLILNKSRFAFGARAFGYYYQYYGSRRRPKANAS